MSKLRKRGTAAKPLSPAEIRALAVERYEAEFASASPAVRAAGLSPATAKREISRVAAAPVTSVVDSFYFAENGRRNPLPAATPAKLRARRDRGGTLGRWESVAESYRVAAGLARFSPDAARALYRKSGGDLEASYVGRGTRSAAPKTRGDVSRTK